MREIKVNIDKMDVMDQLHDNKPSALSFLSKKKLFYSNPSDHSFETLNNYSNPSVDFLLSHGVHRGILKTVRKMIVLFF